MTVKWRRAFIVCSTITIVWVATALTGAVVDPDASVLVVVDSLLIACSIAAVLGIVLARWLIRDD